MPECNLCGQGFTWQEWENRHSDGDGEDIHDRCCETVGPCYRYYRKIP